jgi:hypothetical protein
MKEEEQDKIWSRVPKGSPILRLTGRQTVGRKKTPTPVRNTQHYKGSGAFHFVRLSVLDSGKF